MNEPLFAAIEGGGTKFVCAIGRAGLTIASRQIKTRAPLETLADIRSFLHSAVERHGPVAAMGVACFGPLDVNPASPRFGTIANTPKIEWQSFNILDALRETADIPIGLDTDVNAAALAEARLGAAQGCDPVAYVTVGTGIGVGIVAGRRPIHGTGHPEAGHIRPRRHPLHHHFAGLCPFHGDCLEGLASGPAIEAAWQTPAERLPAAHPCWEAEADYLGQLCSSLILTIAPECIVLGGGVMKQQALYGRVRERTRHWLGGYIARIEDDPALLDQMILPPGCSQPSGLAGAFLLAEEAYTARIVAS